MSQGLKKHVMVTCYDASFAKIVAETGVIDSILVGDSLGMVVQGHDSTLPVTMEQMVYHTAAVVRGVRKAQITKTPPLIIADMPANSYSTPEVALKNALALIEVGANLVKVEGPVFNIVKSLFENGIRVCGHIGLTPQSIQEFKVQGKTASEAARLLDDAKTLSVSGVEILVLEMIPAVLASEITNAISIPTVGIGAGVHCGGQVLVIYDLLGLNKDFNPKFLKKYLNGYDLISSALQKYSSEVSSSVFPSEQNSFRAQTQNPAEV